MSGNVCQLEQVLPALRVILPQADDFEMPSEL